MIKGYQKEIEKIYQRIRSEEEEALRKRKEEIEANHPEILDVDREIGKLCVELSINAFRDIANRDSYLATLKDSITELRIKKSELLVQHGYTLDYLNLHYRCPKCKDTGFIGTKRCICYKSKLIDLYYKDSDLKDMVSSYNFDYFNFSFFSAEKGEGETESPRKKIERIVSKSQDFIKNFGHTNENLLFFGNPGTGKTFLSSCIAKELLDKGYLVVYRTSDSLIQNLRAIKFENGHEELLDLLTDCDLLIIDDLGSEQINDFTKAEFFNFLNRKLLKNKKMLISTNLTLEQILRDYSDRIASRIIGNFTPCKFCGDDIRIKKNLSKIRNS